MKRGSRLNLSSIDTYRTELMNSMGASTSPGSSSPVSASPVASPMASPAVARRDSHVKPAEPPAPTRMYQQQIKNGVLAGSLLSLE